MKVNGFNSNLAFGGASSFSSALNTAAETTKDIADIVSTASMALETPDTLAIKALNGQLEKVSKNEKIPSPVRKIVKYTCGAIATGLTFVGARNLIRGKGFLIDFTKNLLAKSELGKACMNFGKAVKNAYKDLHLAKKLHMEGFVNTVSKYANQATEFLNKQAGKVKTFFTGLIDKSPKIKNGADSVAKKINLKAWTTRDYIANILATTMGVNHAIKVIKTPDEATKPTEITDVAESLATESKENDDKKDIKEAA